MFVWYEKLWCCLLKKWGRYRVVCNDDDYLESSMELLSSAFVESAYQIRIGQGGYLFSLIDTKTNAVLGAAHTYFANELWHDQAQRDNYHLDKFSKAIRSKMIITDSLVLHPSVRNKHFVRMLLCEIYQYYQQRHEVLYHACYCEPSIVHIYQKLNHVAIADTYNQTYGLYRVMMFYDETATLINKPGFLNKFNSRFEFPSVDELMYFDNALLHGVSKTGLKKIYKDAVLVEFNHNDVIIAEGGKAQFISLIMTGKVSIVKHNKVINQLYQGDFMGELSEILGHGRTANAIAQGENTRVLFLAKSVINRIHNLNDQNQILKNIIIEMTRRLVTTSAQSSL